MHGNNIVATELATVPVEPGDSYARTSMNMRMFHLQSASIAILRSPTSRDYVCNTMDMIKKNRIKTINFFKITLELLEMIYTFTLYRS